VKPKVGHLKVFGCAVYPLILKDKQQKLDAKACKCVFLGYSTKRKGYCLYDQSSSRIIYSQDVRFNELMCEVEKESSTTTPDANPQVEVDCSSGESNSLSDDSSDVVEQGANSEGSHTEPEGRTVPSVSWKSSKQSSVVLTTADAEYMSLTLAAQEAI